MSCLLLTLAGLSVLLMVWQGVVASRFPMHQRRAPKQTPPISILKPLKGADQYTALALESWFTQRYAAPFEILMGAAAPDDPALPIAEELIRRHPKIPARVVLCQPLLGANPKVSTLCHLLPRARFERIIVSDDDALAPPDLLEQLTVSMESSAAALVNSFYTLAPDASFGKQWEAFATNADFWTQVLQGVTLRRMDFALGAVMLTSQETLRSIGGFEALLEYLADDFELGKRIARDGGRIALCPVPVECHSDPVSLGEAWAHQLRWARTIRFCRPIGYFLSIISNATLWPLLYLVQAGTRLAAGLFLGALVLRSLLAWWSYYRITRRAPFFALVFAPLKDLLQAGLWAAAFLGNRITWRGERFRVKRGGKLIPLGGSARGT